MIRATPPLALVYLLFAAGALTAQETGAPAEQRLPPPQDAEWYRSDVPIRPDDASLIFDQRVRAIHKRIEALKQIVESRREAARQQELAGQQRVDAEGNPIAATRELPPAGAATDERRTQQNGQVIEGGQATESSGSAMPPARELTTSPAFQVVTSPANSMELANSLFFTRNFEQALKSYEALLASNPSAVDKEWLRCLAANCYRICGDYAKAERLYREVVASKDNAYASDHAKWYLEHLARRQRIRDNLQRIDSELTGLRTARRN